VSVDGVSLPRVPIDAAPGRLQSPTSRGFFGLGACVLVGAAAGFGLRTGVAALLVVAATLVVLRRPAFAALTLVAVAPAISGLRPGLPLPELRLSEVMIGGLSVLILLSARRGHTPPWRAFDWLALGYVVANATLGFFDLTDRGTPIDIANASKLLGPLQFFLLYRAVLTTLTTDAQRRTAIRLVLLASVPVSVLTLLQQAHVAGVPGFLANVTGSQAYLEHTGVPRATGPFPFWHELGSYLFVVLLLGVSLLVGESERVMNRRLLIGVVALAGIGIVNTVSFTPISGAVAGSLLLVLMGRRSQRELVGLTAVAVLLAAVFSPLLEGRYREQFRAPAHVKEIPYLPQNFNFRINVWTTEFVPVLKKNLTTGYGPDLPPNLRFSYTESVYVTLLLRGGLPLLFLYAGLMLALALRSRELRHDPDSDRRAVARALFVVIVLVVFMQMTTNYFVNTGFPHLFWLLAALLLAGSGRASSAARPSDGSRPVQLRASP
jgi:hypothetical protein